MEMKTTKDTLARTGLVVLNEFIVEESGHSFFRCATRIDDDWVPTYSRFIPRKEFITEDNRFSPPGIEWLYLAWADNPENAQRCATAECRIKSGDRFALCEFSAVNKKAQIFDLTIADHHTYDSINNIVSDFIYSTAEKSASIFCKTGKMIAKNELENFTLEMSRLSLVFIYLKMLSSQLFVPIENNKKNMYAPFHCFACYLRTLGYDGIAYSSTVSDEGKNLVLFNKTDAKPVGPITTGICK